MPAQHDSTGAAEVFEQALEGFRTGNLQILIDLLDEDAVWEFPYAPPSRPRRIEGKDNIEKYFRAFLGGGMAVSFTDIEVHHMIDPDGVVVELTGRRTVRATGDYFEGRYVEV